MNPLRLALIQTDLHWEDKEKNLQLLEEKVRAVPAGTHITVLPEMFTTGFSMRPEALAEEMDGPSVAWMKRLAAEKRTVLTGSLIIREGGRYFNRLVWMLPNGQMGIYDKRHLFNHAGEGEHYTPGTQRFIASVNGWRILVNICYDLRFPVWSRQQYGAQMEYEYDAIIYTANWPERRSLAWRTLLQARAIENQCYVAGVNRVGTDGNGLYHRGDTMAADPLGEVLYHQADAEDTAIVTFDPVHLRAIRQKLAFNEDADRFEIVNG